ncbi:MAG: hypothetical protein ACXWPS_02685 [Ktedonobacteraceae bacterium]
MTTVFQGRSRCAHFVVIALYFSFEENDQSIQTSTVAGLSNAPLCRLRRLGEEEGAWTRYCIPQMRGLALRHRANRPLQSPLWRVLESPV